MTDGERLVWATTYSLAFNTKDDAIGAARIAARAVEHMREAVHQTLPGGVNSLEPTEREFLDEIVSVP